MNHSPSKQTSESQLNLRKVYEGILENLLRLEDSVRFAKVVLSECSDKFNDIRSQMTQLKTTVDGSFSNKQESAGADKSTREESLKEAGADENTEVIFERQEIVIDSPKSQISGRKKRRISLGSEEVISVSSLETSRPCVAGPSTDHGMANISLANNANTPSAVENLGDSAAEATQIALLQTQGILPPNDFRTFLYLSGTVEDPVQLAKVSFTTDVKMLYYQLTNFHFHLRNMNDANENGKGPFSTDRSLEDRLQILILAFTPES